MKLINNLIRRRNERKIRQDTLKWRKRLFEQINSHIEQQRLDQNFNYRIKTWKK